MATKSWSVVWTGMGCDGMCAAADPILSFCSLFFQRVLSAAIPRVFFSSSVLFVRFVCPLLFVPGTQVQGKARFALFVRARVLAYLCMYAGE